MSGPAPISVLFLLYPGIDILDFTGPLEALHSARHPSSQASDPNRLHGAKVFTPTLAAADPTVTSGAGVTVSRDITLSQALSTIGDYAMVVVPGAMPDRIVPNLVDEHEMIKTINAFAALPGTMDAGGRPVERTLLSVCTGAYWLAHTGMLRGRRATTHWMMLDEFEKLSGAKVDRRKYVDVGKLGGKEDGVRVITAGGVSGGIDGALYLVERVGGLDMAKLAAGVMDYDWKKEENP